MAEGDESATAEEDFAPQPPKPNAREDAEVEEDGPGSRSSMLVGDVTEEVVVVSRSKVQPYGQSPSTNENVRKVNMHKARLILFCD